jgi:hypothetical protein
MRLKNKFLVGVSVTMLSLAVLVLVPAVVYFLHPDFWQYSTVYENGQVRASGHGSGYFEATYHSISFRDPDHTSVKNLPVVVDIRGETFSADQLNRDVLKNLGAEVSERAERYVCWTLRYNRYSLNFNVDESGEITNIYIYTAMWNNDFSRRQLPAKVKWENSGWFGPNLKGDEMEAIFGEGEVDPRFHIGP